MRVQYFFGSKIYALADFWPIFFPARNFCRPVDPSEVKKTLIFEVFCQKIQKSVIFG